MRLGCAKQLDCWSCRAIANAFRSKVIMSRERSLGCVARIVMAEVTVSVNVNMPTSATSVHWLAVLVQLSLTHRRPLVRSRRGLATADYTRARLRQLQLEAATARCRWLQARWNGCGAAGTSLLGTTRLLCFRSGRVSRTSRACAVSVRAVRAFWAVTKLCWWLQVRCEAVAGLLVLLFRHDATSVFSHWPCFAHFTGLHWRIPGCSCCLGRGRPITTAPFHRRTVSPPPFATPPPPSP